MPDCFACSAPLEEETIIKLQMLLINKLLTNAQWPFQTASTKQQDNNERGIELSTRRRRYGVPARSQTFRVKTEPRGYQRAYLVSISAAQWQARRKWCPRFFAINKRLCLLARCQGLLKLRSYLLGNIYTRRKTTKQRRTFSEFIFLHMSFID